MQNLTERQAKALRTELKNAGFKKIRQWSERGEKGTTWKLRKIQVSVVGSYLNPEVGYTVTAMVN